MNYESSPQLFVALHSSVQLFAKPAGAPRPPDHLRSQFLTGGLTKCVPIQTMLPLFDTAGNHFSTFSQHRNPIIMLHPGARGVWTLCGRLSLPAKGRSDSGRLSLNVKSARRCRKVTFVRRARLFVRESISRRSDSLFRIRKPLKNEKPRLSEAWIISK